MSTDALYPDVSVSSLLETSGMSGNVRGGSPPSWDKDFDARWYRCDDLFHLRRCGTCAQTSMRAAAACAASAALLTCSGWPAPSAHFSAFVGKSFF